MVRKVSLVLFAVALAASSAFAQGGPVVTTVSTTVASMYEWNGFNRVKASGLEDGPVVQPRVSVGVPNTGFNFVVGGSFVVNEESELHEMTYGVNVVKSVSPLVDAGVGYNFYDNRVDQVRGVAVSDVNTHEVWGTVELKSSIGVRPGVTVKYEKPNVDTQDAYVVAVGGLKYAMPLSGVNVGGAGVNLDWSTSVVYNGGVVVGGKDLSSGVVVGGVDVPSGVSAVQFGLASAVHAGRVVVTPAVNYQVTVQDAVSTENEVWATVGVAWGF